MLSLKKCMICPHCCGSNRKEKTGRCQASDKVEIALASLHSFEEPCISGTKGSGTIFFSHCNLKCIYCQNHEISHEGKGKEISVEHLADLLLRQQEKGAHNINLVTPTMYTIQIKEAIQIAKERGLQIPIIYNCGGYESVEALKMLRGYIDIYLPDFKYMIPELSFRYSGVRDYEKVAKLAILEMYEQVGIPILDQDSIMKRGLMIRHMVLPNCLENSKKILKWIVENLPKEVYVSIMAQYFPTYLAKNDNIINRKLTQEEWKEIEEYIEEIGIENGYIQELGEHEEEYVPNFDFSE